MREKNIMLSVRSWTEYRHVWMAFVTFPLYHPTVGYFDFVMNDLWIYVGFPLLSRVQFRLDASGSCCMTFSCSLTYSRVESLLLFPTFSYFLGSLLLFPTLGSNSYFFLLFRILPNLSPKNAVLWEKNFQPRFARHSFLYTIHFCTNSLTFCSQTLIDLVAELMSIVYNVYIHKCVWWGGGWFNQIIFNLRLSQLLSSIWFLPFISR